jgi:hypothetical protein
MLVLEKVQDPDPVLQAFVFRGLQELRIGPVSVFLTEEGGRGVVESRSMGVFGPLRRS